jgi:hypothetical protein
LINSMLTQEVIQVAVLIELAVLAFLIDRMTRVLIEQRYPRPPRGFENGHVRLKHHRFKTAAEIRKRRLGTQKRRDQNS